MPMNPNFLCCIGAELKNSTQQTTRMSQVYLYRSFEDETLSDMLSAGFFNAAMGIIRQDDLLLLYSPNETTAKYTYARVSSVSSSGVVITPIGIDASQIAVDTTGYSNLSGNNLQEILNNLDTTLTTINNAFVRKDGSSVMTGPLKFRAGSFVGAIAGGLGDGISIYKLKSDDSIDSEVASLTKENGFTPGTTNAQDIGSSSLKWKDLYVARVIASVLNNGANIDIPTTGGTMALLDNIKNSTINVQLDGSDVDSFTLNQSSNKTINIPAANKDLSNLTSTGKNIGNWSSNVTNCITEIPQDIKLELNNGTLTLKAGSKVYIPNGAGVFDELLIDNDNSQASSSANSTQMVCYIPSISSIAVRPLSNCVSGAGATATAGYAYDTTANAIKYYNSSSQVQYTGCSLPLGIASTDASGNFVSIDYIFNGFGDIGSTIFALPGVKGSIPDGRNADGTLKNTAFTVSSVLVNTGTGTDNKIAIRLNANEIATGDLNYDEINNYNRHVTNNETRAYAIVGYLKRTSGVINSFSTKTAFHAVDYNDSDYIANCAMPSDRYVDLTLPTSGQSVTAPADGYIYLNKVATATSQYIRIGKSGGFLQTETIAAASDNWLRVWLPVSKGNVITINYNAGGTTNYFRFIYANGAK